MTAQLLDGRACSANVKAHVKKAIAERQAQGLTLPGLDVILVGENPASLSYVGHKQRACEEAGIRSRVHRLPADTSPQDLAAQIDACNEDPSVHGILLQLPLPAGLQPDDFLERIQPQKDVDGFHPYNLGRLIQKRPTLRPCTPYGIMTLLKTMPEAIEGKHAVVVGASNIVGRPMALELLLARCTVTVCHSRTQHLDQHVGAADILIAATGRYGLVKSEWIKPGAMVIDVGFSRLDNGKIVGDIEFETAAKRASWITPVPGGVGPMTVATLLENTLQAATYFDK